MAQAQEPNSKAKWPQSSSTFKATVDFANGESTWKGVNVPDYTQIKLPISIKSVARTTLYMVHLIKVGGQLSSPLSIEMVQILNIMEQMWKQRFGRNGQSLALSTEEDLEKLMASMCIQKGVDMQWWNEWSSLFVAILWMQHDAEKLVPIHPTCSANRILRRLPQYAGQEEQSGLHEEDCWVHPLFLKQWRASALQKDSRTMPNVHLFYLKHGVWRAYGAQCLAICHGIAVRPLIKNSSHLMKVDFT